VGLCQPTVVTVQRILHVAVIDWHGYKYRLPHDLG
jgi:hypothetical protein